MNLLWSAAAADITPLHPVVLGGRSGAARVSNSTHSPLEVNASLLRDTQGAAVVLIAFDLLYVGAPLRDHVLGRLAERGIPAPAVWMAASHTHHAPMTDRSKPGLGSVDDGYLRLLYERCDFVLARLFDAEAVSVRAEHARVHCESNVNRRRHWPWPTWTRDGLRPTGATVMAPAPDAPRDTALDQIRFVDLAGRCRGVWWKYACHPVALQNPSTLSAEYPGVVRQALRSRCGAPDLPVMFLQGFAGDVRPMIPEAVDPRPWVQRLRTGPTFGTPTEAEWTRWWSGIEQRALVPWHDATWQPIAPALRVEAQAVPWSTMLDGPVGGALQLQRLALGDSVDLLGGNAEFCSPWLRWGRPGRTTVHVGYLGDVFGYLPSEQQVREGGYEVHGFMRPFGHNVRWRKGFELQLDAAIGHIDPAH